MEVEDRAHDPGGTGLGDEQLEPPATGPLKRNSMKRFSENGARPVLDPGEPLAQPFGRLGALVFQPDNTDTIMLGGAWL